MIFSSSTTILSTTIMILIQLSTLLLFLSRPVLANQGDASTFDMVYKDDSVLEFAQVGKYYGADGIAEYLLFVAGAFLFKTSS
jgi:hypothetical protein